MPSPAAALLASGAALARQGRLNQAEAVFRQLLAAEPDQADARYNLGVVLRDQGRMVEAEAAFRAALQVRPGHAESWNNLGQALLARKAAMAAAQAFRQALALKPDHARALNNLGAAMLDLGSLDAAVDAFRRAIDLNPAYAKAHNNLGVALQYQGALPQAAAAFAQAVQADPAYAEARLNLAGLTPAGPDADRLADEIAALARGETGAPARSALLFALGHLREQAGQFDAAFDAFAEANALRRQDLSFDIAAAEARLEAIAAAFRPDLLARLAGAGIASHRPIFIVGMPRSGTTLIEQILSAHPAVQGGGELRAMGEIISAHGAPAAPFPSWVADLSPEACARLGQAYLAALPPAAPGQTRVTDKAVSNIETVALIHLILPRAAIIHCRRDPWDAAMSCFATRFSEGQDFAYDLTELGRYWRACERLMDHWRAILPPGRMLEIDYEAVVGDLEGQARQLIAHCGLEWDPACLAFHASGREVRTASAAQVRRPLYGSSIGRWRRFEHRLGPLIEALEG
ncbi:MAG TPA: sulfotransferase [Caulobacteraceae bacterium]|nr:sulfotransferase [Caulobacteraceae bacterium]